MFYNFSGKIFFHRLSREKPIERGDNEKLITENFKSVKNFLLF